MEILSQLTTELDRKNINRICKLKNSYWKFGLQSQLKWFKKYIKDNDIHNLIYLNDDLIGYNLLRKRRCKVYYDNKNINLKHLYFDTLVIKNNYRKKGYGELLMTQNKKVILNENLFSFLICDNNSVVFYQKFGWSTIKNKNIKILDHKFSTNGMLFNNKIIKQINKIHIKNIIFKFFIHQ